LCRYRHFADATQLDVELSYVAINGPAGQVEWKIFYPILLLYRS